MDLQAYLYDANGHDREVDLNEVALDKLGEDDLLWIDVHSGDKSNLERLTDLFGLQPDVWSTDDVERSQSPTAPALHDHR